MKKIRRKGKFYEVDISGVKTEITKEEYNQSSLLDKVAPQLEENSYAESLLDEAETEEEEAF